MATFYPDTDKIGFQMTPDDMFQIANPVAMLGWIALVAAPLAPRMADAVANLIIPLLMSVAYSALIQIGRASCRERV